LSIELEAGFSSDIIRELKKRGHNVQSNAPTFLSEGLGGAQLIFSLEDGYCAASDPRKDGQALGF
jgi:gamma-glutamyltranspeptidase/glutathione hydrolase